MTFRKKLRVRIISLAKEVNAMFTQGFSPIALRLL